MRVTWGLAGFILSRIALRVEGFGELRVASQLRAAYAYPYLFFAAAVLTRCDRSAGCTRRYNVKAVQW